MRKEDARSFEFQMVRLLDLPGPVEEMAWLGAGTSFFLRGPQGLWILQSLDGEWEQVSSEEVTAAAWSHDGRWLSFAVPGRIEFWAKSPSSHLESIPNEAGCKSLTWGSHTIHGYRLECLTSDGEPFGYRISNKAKPVTHEGRPKPLARMMYSPDGTLLALLLSDGRLEITKEIADASTSELVWSSSFFERPVAMAWAPDNTRLAVALADGTIRIQSVSKKLVESRTLKSLSAIASLSFSNDSTLLSASDEKKTLQLWELATGADVAFNLAASNIAFHPQQFLCAILDPLGQLQMGQFSLGRRELRKIDTAKSTNRMGSGLRSLERQLDRSNIPASQPGRNLKLATWNLRELGATNRQEQSLRIIARVLQRFDLIALCEVTRADTDLKRIIDMMGANWSLLMAEPNKSRFRCAFLYNRDSVKHDGMALSLHFAEWTGQSPPLEWHRPPYLAGFQADGYSFLAVAIHIRIREQQERSQEIKELVRAIDALRAENKDDIEQIFVMGTHQAVTKEQRIALTRYGLQVPPALTGVSATSLIDPKVFDGILCYPESISTRTGRGGVLNFFADHWEDLYSDSDKKPADLEEFTREISDHLPIWLEIDLAASPGEEQGIEQQVQKAQKPESGTGLSHRPGQKGEEQQVQDARELEFAADLSYRPGYQADVAYGKDQFNLDREVTTLSAVIMDKDWKPPLSIGLFGDWGTGKSFFIHLMEEKIKQMAEDSRQAALHHQKCAFTTHVAQIKFNAWHYIDANLWASLVTRLFEGITTGLFGDQPDLEEKEAKATLEALYAKLETINGQMLETRQQEETLKQLEQQTLQKRDELKREESYLNQVFDNLRSIRKEDFDKLMQAYPALDKEVEKLRHELNYDKAINVFKNLASLLEESATLWGRTKQILQKMKDAPTSFAIMGIGLALFILATANYQWLLRNVKSVGSLVVTITPLVATWVPILNKYIGKANRVLDLAEHTQELAERAHAQRLQEIRAQQREINERLESQQRDVKAIQQKISDIKKGLSLEGFLRERVGSADYCAQLGIIAMVRKDLEKLGDRLERGFSIKREGQPDDIVRLDRIILYIDDLDRCPPSRVLEVLQAAHMLLSVPYFIVITAADPRWLLHSLRRHYQELLVTQGAQAQKAEDQYASWASSPQNYLDKIFQIPYTLPGMTEVGYENLIRSLFELPKEDKGELLPPEVIDVSSNTADDQLPEEKLIVADSDKPPKVGGGVITSTSDKDKDLYPPDAKSAKGVIIEGRERTPGKLKDESSEPKTAVGGAKVIAQARQTNPTPKTPGGKPDSKPAVSVRRMKEPWTPRVNLNPDSLKVQEWELRFLERLHVLVTTPRSAKKLANIYRLIRTGLAEGNLKSFIGSEKGGGEYHAVMLMLGVMIGFPDLAADFFRVLRRTSEVTFDKVVSQELRPKSEVKSDGKQKTMFRNAVRVGLDTDDARHWIRLTDALSLIMQSTRCDTAMQPFKKWMKTVLRYSFRAGYIMKSIEKESALLPEGLPPEGPPRGMEP